MTGRKKGMSIGAAMKQRMNTQEEQAAPAAEQESRPPRARRTASTPLPEPGIVDPLESFNTRLPHSLQRRLKVHTAVEGTKIQDVVQRALDEYLSRYEKK